MVFSSSSLAAAAAAARLFATLGVPPRSAQDALAVDAAAAFR
jgi:hypothetical protein